MEMQSRVRPALCFGCEMKHKLLILSIALVLVALASPYPRWRRHQEAVQNICNLVVDRFYLGSENLIAWGDQCRKMKSGYFESANGLRKKIQSHLGQLGASHLMVYTPAEDRRMWQGLDRVTGLSVKDVDGHAIVFKVMPESSAEKAGCRTGDEIVMVHGRPIEFLSEAETSAGEYRIRRMQNGQLVELDLQIETSDIRVDGGPVVKDLEGQRGILAVSSFRAEYFSSSGLHLLFEKASKFKNLVLDLRGNSGGNLVAMMRLASALTCEPRRVGEIVQPRTQGSKSTRMPDDLDEGRQLDLLSRYHRIELQTYPGYECFRGPLAVLVDHETSSVSEILAEFLKSRPQTRVFGEGTAGDVLLAAWYDLPELGRGSTLSIPESLYLDHRGLSLERAGVLPDKPLNYDLVMARLGKDSMLNEALNSLSARTGRL